MRNSDVTADPPPLVRPSPRPRARVDLADLDDTVRRRALAKDRSLSDEIRHLVRRALEAEKQKGA